MKVWMAWLVLVGSLVSGVIEADPRDGNTLLKACRLAVKNADGEVIPLHQKIDVGYCLGFMEAMRHQLVAYKSYTPEYVVCLPSSLTNIIAARIFVKYFDNHPEELSTFDDGTSQTIIALGDAYPCK